MAYIEWCVNIQPGHDIFLYNFIRCRYYIIAHEIAHNKTPFHDEHHELLVVALGSRFLQPLHDVSGVREYFAC
jgi:hypothetical protein